jgi:hypothetical protein
MRRVQAKNVFSTFCYRPARHQQCQLLLTWPPSAKKQIRMNLVGAIAAHQMVFN